VPQSFTGESAMPASTCHDEWNANRRWCMSNPISGNVHDARGRTTLGEFERMPEEDAYRIELARGLVVREPRPAPLHARVQARLAFHLESWSQATKRGSVLTDCGFILEEAPPTVRGPDLAWVSAGRVPASGYSGGFWRVAPDLVVEILSPHDRATAIREKVQEYLRAGSRVVWVVDPLARTATLFAPDGSSQTVVPEGILDGGEVLPGFRVSLSDLFTL
jgi:Uma2 family endonuclease